MTTTYVTVKDLDAPIQEALASVGYGRKDIAVKVSATVELSGASGDGYRAFAILVNLVTGDYETHQGSWGGTNAFTRTAVDDDTRHHTLPGHGVVITGQRGGGRPVYATLHIPASMTARILPPAAGPELTPEMVEGLFCHVSVRGGAYRREALQRRNVTPATLDALVELGLISRNRAGATQVTTAGRNAFAATGHRGW